MGYELTSPPLASIHPSPSIPILPRILLNIEGYYHRQNLYTYTLTWMDFRAFAEN